MTGTFARSSTTTLESATKRERRDSWRPPSAGCAVFVMEPLLGGRLAGKLPPRARAVFDGVRDPYLKTPAAWGLSWVWNHPQVTMLLSGMTDTAQVDENAALADRALPDSMTATQLDTIARVLGEFEKSNRVLYGVRLLHAVPQGYQYSRQLWRYNASYAHSWFTGLSQYFTASAVRTNEPKLVSNCVKCGKCARTAHSTSIFPSVSTMCADVSSPGP